MSAFLNDLAQLKDELAKVDLDAPYAPKPWQEILSSDHVVGELCEVGRRIFILLATVETVSHHARGNLLRIAQDEGKNPQDPSYDGRRRECFRYAVRAQLLNTVLLAEARIAFPEIMDKPFVFVRAGWKVVWRENPEGVQTSPADASEQETAAPRRLN
jgi:hypothetical protein